MKALKAESQISVVTLVVTAQRRSRQLNHYFVTEILTDVVTGCTKMEETIIAVWVNCRRLC